MSTSHGWRAVEERAHVLFCPKWRVLLKGVACGFIAARRRASWSSFLQGLSMDQTVTQAEFAKVVGISDARASQLASEGVLKAGEPVGAWIRAYCERLRAQASRRPTDGDPALTAERTGLTRAKREQEELRLAEMCGELVRVDVVRDEFGKLLAATRDNLFQIPARSAAVLAAESSQERVYEFLQDELCRALQMLADTFRSEP